jgi:hypothetical protein
MLAMSSLLLDERLLAVRHGIVGGAAGDGDAGAGMEDDQ